MDPDQAARQKQAQEEIVRREMYRKSRDIIRIYNPLAIDFKFYFDGYPQIIKARQTKDVERYLARLYFKKMSDYLIGQMQVAKGSELLSKRKKEGYPDYLDKYVENTEIWNKVPKQNDPELLKEISDQIILGLVEEFGFDVPEPKNVEAPVTADIRTVHDRLIDDFNKPIPEEKMASEETEPPVKPVKEKLKMEATIND